MCINVFVIRSLLFRKGGSSWEGNMEKGEEGEEKERRVRARAVCTLWLDVFLLTLTR